MGRPGGSNKGIKHARYTAFIHIADKYISPKWLDILKVLTLKEYISLNKMYWLLISLFISEGCHNWLTSTWLVSIIHTRFKHVVYTRSVSSLVLSSILPHGCPMLCLWKIYSGTWHLSIKLYNVADKEPIEGDDGFPLVMDVSVFTPDSRPPTLCLDHRPATEMNVVASSTCLCRSHPRPPHTHAHAQTHTHTEHAALLPGMPLPSTPWSSHSSHKTLPRSHLL